jgi:hypothetical protein
MMQYALSRIGNVRVKRPRQTAIEFPQDTCTFVGVASADSNSYPLIVNYPVGRIVDKTFLYSLAKAWVWKNIDIYE